jgi:hypothetical protein
VAKETNDMAMEWYLPTLGIALNNPNSSGWKISVEMISMGHNDFLVKRGTTVGPRLHKIK